MEQREKVGIGMSAALLADWSYWMGPGRAVAAAEQRAGGVWQK